MTRPDALPDLAPDVLTALETQFGLGPLRRLSSAGIVNRAYSDGRAVLRAAVQPGEEDSHTEVVAVPLAVAAGVRTPPLLAHDLTSALVGAPVTVYAHAPGRNLADTGWDPDDARAVRACHQLGAELARLHQAVTVAPDPYGWLDTHPPLPHARLLARLTGEGLLSGQEARWAARVFGEADALPPLPQVFLHGDVHPANVLVGEDGELSALLDWGDAGWGSPVQDLTYAGARHARHLWAGYEAAAPGRLGPQARAHLLAALLYDALRSLRRPPAPGGPDLWYSRPGSALTELLHLLWDGAPDGVG